MTESQREKLNSYPSKYLSIGITEDGEPRFFGWVPWDSMADAFNMRTPQVFFSPEDLTDEAIWTELSRFHINGCYIYCPLTDYSFLERLTELHVTSCMECGCCSYVCPANRPLVQTNRMAKILLREEKAKEDAKK